MLEPIKNLLEKSLARARIKPQVDAALVLASFERQVRRLWGEAMAEKVTPMYLRDKCLTVAVASGLYGQEIKLREREILGQINQEMKGEVVRRIVCLL